MTSEIRQLLNDFANAMSRHEKEINTMTENDYIRVKNAIISTYVTMIERLT